MTIEEILSFVEKDTPNQKYDIEFFEYIQKRLKDEDVGKLVFHVKSEEEIKEMIDTFSSDTIETIIELINKEEFTKYCIENSYELQPPAKVRLIRQLGNPRYTKRCIEENIAKIGVKQIVDLMLELDDPDYVKKCVLENKANLGVYTIKEILMGLHDSKFTIQCLESDLLKELDFRERIQLLINSGDKDKIREWSETIQYPRTRAILRYFLQDKAYTPNKKKITIPDDLRYGIEIESEGPYSEDLEDYATAIYSRKERIERAKKGITSSGVVNGWTVGPDGDAVEFSSPILDNSENSLNEIYRTCEMLQDLCQEITIDDGGHIHFGADYFEPKEGEQTFETKNAYANLMEIYCNCEKIFLAIGNAPGVLPRDNLEYATPVSAKYSFATRILANDEGTKKRIQKMNKSEFYKYLITLNGDREQAINFENLRTEAKPNTMHTIEFRFPNGTINPDTWAENINLLGGLMRASKELAIIQSKKIDELTPEDIVKIQILQCLKSRYISDDEKVDLLLTLLVSEEESKIYIDRFCENYWAIDALGKEDRLGSVLEYKLTKNTVDFTSWRPNSEVVGKYCYTSNNPEKEAVNGESMITTQARFDRDLANIREESRV